MLPLILATEDALSEAIGLRLTALFPDLPVRQPPLRRNGNGYLRSKLPAFCDYAGKGPVLVLTDLDTQVCPSKLIATWFGRRPRPARLLLRVAVRQIEAWLLADHDAMVSLLGARLRGQLPEQPDQLPNAKDALLLLAQSGPRDVRADLCPERGVIARQGLNYNTRLCHLVEDTWDPLRASALSPSLARAIHRLQQFVATVRP